MFLPEAVYEVIDEVRHWGGRPYLVGGCVRDWVYGKMRDVKVEFKDFDIEVFDISLDYLQCALSTLGDVKDVGKSFGVFKLSLDGIEIDVSLPRRESKASSGHRGFDVVPDSTMPLIEAARRRDFTMNAMMWNPFKRELYDFFQGEDALRRKQLVHVDDTTFVDDPLRVIRGVQFCGRFGLQAVDRTLHLCRSIGHTYSELSIERIWGEWEKWACRSVFPRMGLLFLAESGWMQHYPELAALIGCEQDELWHPEGDVFIHSSYVVDEAAEIARRDGLNEHDTLVLVLSALCHDMGKPLTTVRHVETGKILSPGHADAGVPVAESFLSKIGAAKMNLALVAEVLPLVREHMCHLSWGHDAPSDRALRRLARDLAPSSIEQLARLTEADVSGRPPLPREQPVQVALARAREVRINLVPPVQIIFGRHVLETFLGMKPGRDVGVRVRAAFEAQLDGAFGDLAGGVDWLREHFS